MFQEHKIVFFGGNQLSVIALTRLLENGVMPDLIITSPDERVGKKRVLTPPPLKQAAEKLGLEILQPESLKNENTLEKIKKLQPDLGIVAAYGKLIPPTVLNLFPRGVLNLHPSILPKYRGPSPIQSAILNNEKETGVTIILLDEKMDRGPILAQEEIALSGHEYFQELYEKLASLGSELLLKTIPLWLENKIAPLPQDDDEATICKKLERQDGKINLEENVEIVYAKIRALSNEPGAWLQLSTKDSQSTIKTLDLKIIKARPNEDNQPPNDNLGLSAQNKNLFLVCKNGTLLLELVQPEGKQIMSGKEFLNGYGKLVFRF